MLVLAALTAEESYGYQLVSRLRDAGLSDLTTGTVYPVLNRLEREGQIRSRLVPSATGPARKYYLPTELGTDTLHRSATAWTALTHTVATVLNVKEAP